MSKLTLTLGLPASGKSTWAKEQEQHDENIVRVNRDNIRTELFGWEYHNGGFSPEAEAKVTAVEVARVARLLAHGHHVISDNTYLSITNVQDMLYVAREAGAKVALQPFNVDAEECKRRNALRGANGGREVPEFVMDSMIKKSYDESGNLKEYIIEDYQVRYKK